MSKPKKKLNENGEWTTTQFIITYHTFKHPILSPVSIKEYYINGKKVEELPIDFLYDMAFKFMLEVSLGDK